MSVADKNLVILSVISSGAFYDAMQMLIAPFKEKYKIDIALSSGSSIGESETSIPHRLSRGEKFDVVILAEKELEILIDENLISAELHSKLVFSHIGAVVPHGVIIPDLSTEDNAIKALLDARKIGYSASMSGTHLSTEIFPKLDADIYKEIAPKLEKVIGDRVAKKVADGLFDIGFQEISEIMPFTKGDNPVQLVTPIPEGWQQTNIFSIGVVKHSEHIEAAVKLMHYLGSPDAKDIIHSEGLEQYLHDDVGE